MLIGGYVGDVVYRRKLLTMRNNNSCFVSSSNLELCWFEELYGKFYVLIEAGTWSRDLTLRNVIWRVHKVACIIDGAS